MLAPAVMFIESAIDSMKHVTPFIHAAQIRELASVGDAQWKALGVTNTEDLSFGYELGLQTMRVLIAGSADPRQL